MPQLHKAVDVVRYFSRTLIISIDMRHFIFTLIMLTGLTLLPKAQSTNLSTIIEAYNSSSLNNAWKKLSTSKSFQGTVIFDNLKNDSLLIGTIDKDKITGKLLGKKVKIEFTTTRKAVFLDIQKQATKKLFHSGDYARGSAAVTRYHHVYSNKSEMQLGDLWFILTECVSKDRKPTFYELTLTAYNED